MAEAAYQQLPSGWYTNRVLDNRFKMLPIGHGHHHYLFAYLYLLMRMTLAQPRLQPMLPCAGTEWPGTPWSCHCRGCLREVQHTGQPEPRLAYVVGGGKCKWAMQW